MRTTFELVTKASLLLCCKDIFCVSKLLLIVSFVKRKYQALSYVSKLKSATVLSACCKFVVVPEECTLSIFVSLFPPDVIPACVPMFPDVAVVVFGPSPTAK